MDIKIQDLFTFWFFGLFLGLMLFYTGTAFAESPNLMITGMIESRMPNQYIVEYGICTTEYRVQDPKILFRSDVGSFGPFTIKGTIEAKNCGFDTVTVKANDPKSISLELVDEFSKIQQLEKEITSLKEQLKAKDEVIKTQLEVIMNLASKIKSTFYEVTGILFS